MLINTEKCFVIQCRNLLTHESKSNRKGDSIERTIHLIDFSVYEEGHCVKEAGKIKARLDIYVHMPINRLTINPWKQIENNYIVYIY